MRVVILYRKDNDRYPEVRTWLGDFERRNAGKGLEEIDPDSREGISMMESYDILELPTVMALDSGGNVVNQWVGTLPNLGEAAYYLNS